MKKTKFAMKEAGQLLPPFEETLERFIAENPDIKITGLDKTHLSRPHPDKPMTALDHLYKAVRALNSEVNGLSGYSSIELQDLIDLIDILVVHREKLCREMSRRELEYFGVTHE